MDKKNCLSYEEQFKDTLNPEEISRIENNEIRNIRFRYLNFKNKAFRDESNISDLDLGKVLDNLCLAEQKELEPYKKDLL